MFTKTSTMLLEGLKDTRNDGVWSQFSHRYRPILVGVARRMGFSEPDAEDIAQQTLSEFVASYTQGKYQRGKGRLSSWLLGTAINVARAHRRKNARQPAQHAAEESIEDESALAPAWEEQQQRAIIAEALTQLRAESKFDERTLEAFELVGPRNMPPAEVARLCKMTTNEVYVAKHRVTSRLREIVSQIAEAYTQEE